MNHWRLAWPDSVLYKGGSSAASEQLQRQSLQQSQKQFEANMALQKTQMSQALPAIPAPQPIAPAPTKTSAEVAQASYQARIDAAKRKGLLASNVAGNTGGYGGTGSVAAGARQTLFG